MDKKPPNLGGVDYSGAKGSGDDVAISFRPVTEGLGFHPFSDGLPYAPMGKNPKSGGMTGGTGALAAGPPRMVTKVISPSKISMSQMSLQPTEQSTGLPKGTQEIVGFPSSRVPRISVPVAKKEGLAPPLRPPQQNFKKNSIGMAFVATRSLAYLFDVSFNSLMLGGILVGLVWKGELQIDLLLGNGVPVGTVVFFLISSWVLIAFQEILFRSSLGKYLFRLRLDGSRFKIVQRTLLFPVSIGFFGLGIFWALLHARRSCWHDILTGVQPVEPSL